MRILEHKIGVRLLDRATNRVALSEEGARVTFLTKKLFAMCAGNVAAVQRMKRGESSQRIHSWLLLKIVTELETHTHTAIDAMHAIVLAASSPV